MEDVLGVVDQDDAQQPVEVAVGDVDLVELQLIEKLARRVTERSAVASTHGRERDHDGDGDHEIGHEGRQGVATAPGEVAARGLGVACFLVEPAQTRGYLGPIFAWGAPLALAVGLERAREVAFADQCRGHLAPGSIDDRGVAESGRLLPRLARLDLAIQPIQRVAGSKEPCRRNIPIAERRRLQVQGQRLLGLAALHQFVGLLDGGDGRGAIPEMPATPKPGAPPGRGSGVPLRTRPAEALSI